MVAIITNLSHTYTHIVAKKLSSANLLTPLPEPWQEFYDERYKRCYYYNPQTQQSSWERPVAPPTSLPTPAPPQPVAKSPRVPVRSDTVQGRPLPAAPGSDSGDRSPESTKSVRRMSDLSGSMSPRQKKAQQPLPALPDKEEKPRHRRNTEYGRNVGRIDPQVRDAPPQLPVRGQSESHVGRGRGALPALPPKEEDPSRLTTSSPSHKSGSMSRSPNFGRRGPVPAPPGQLTQPQQKEDAPLKRFQRTTIPSLPPKEPEKALPQIPQIQTNGSIPPLPPKEAELPIPPETDKPLPPLPPKPASPSPPRAISPPGVAASSKKSRKNIAEYEDFPIRQPPKAKANVPPLPDKEPAASTPAAAAPPPPPPPVPVVNGAPPPPPVVNGSGAPPPPPPPPVGVPVPPPPPPSAPPSNPTRSAASPKQPPPARTQSSSSEEGGRPFTANDLAAAKTLLKKRKEVPETERRPAANSGFAGVFANAIDSRMTSIRKAMVDSDSGESEFEDVDDDWD